MHNLKPQYIKLEKENRLLDSAHPIIGLTGGIATGKTTVSNYLRKKGIPLICADFIVKEVYQTEKMKNLLKSLVPKVFSEDDQIDFSLLRTLFFNDKDIKDQIEKVIFSIYPQEFEKKYNNLDFSEYQFFIYDVPLLFEKKLQTKIDCTWLVYSSQEIQLKRLLERDPKTNKKLAQKILDSQFSINEKKLLADLVIDNSSTLEFLHHQVDDALTHYLE